MKAIQLPPLLLFLISFAPAREAKAQPVFISSAGTSRGLFNAMGTGTALPVGWRVNTAADGSSATLTWNGTDETSGFVHSSSQVSHYMPGGWVPGTSGVATEADPYSRAGITSFSPFGVASASIPLLLDLISFVGDLQDKVVHLRWEIAKEDGLRNFDVERSLDGVDYRGIGRVEATGEPHHEYRFEGH